MEVTSLPEEGEALRDLISAQIKRHKDIRHELLFAMVAGSYAFNLNVESSDKDYFAVYAANIDDVLDTLQPPPDHVIYEAAYFCHLLLKGNPKVIEPLYVEHRCYYIDIWRDLQRVRKALMTQQTLKHYAAYGLSQLSDLNKKKGGESKKFYHALRLLQEAENIATGGEPRVWWEGEKRDFLLNVRRGNYSTEALKKMVDDLDAKVTSLMPQLPPITDIKVLDEWLLKVRRRHLPSGAEQKLLLPVDGADGSLRERAQALLARHGIEGTVLCVVATGSTVYGTRVKGSNEDFVGIFALPTERCLSLVPHPQKVDEEGGVDAKLNETYTRGLLLLELGLAMALLSKGNHRLIEAVFYDGPTQYSTVFWQQVKEQRAAFVTKTLVNHYLGVAKGQLGAKKDSPSEGNSKGTYQAVRLMMEAENILKAGKPALRLENPSFLLEVRENRMPAERLKETIEALSQNATSLLKASTLPQKADINPLRKLLVAVRRELA